MTKIINKLKLFSRSELIAVILIKNPKKGGSPAREKKLIVNEILGPKGKLILWRDVIFWMLNIINK